MTPQTVNAYYNPGLNEIVFPAAILQPPFFDAEGDDADNYGGIGAVIGHEIGHGFDDAGSTFDGQGNLRDWWTEADRAAFEERRDALVTLRGVSQSNARVSETMRSLDASPYLTDVRLIETLGLDRNGQRVVRFALQLRMDRPVIEAMGAEKPAAEGKP